MFQLHGYDMCDTEFRYALVPYKSLLKEEEYHSEY
jgi:hypothetical protein